MICTFPPELIKIGVLANSPISAPFSSPQLLLLMFTPNVFENIRNLWITEDSKPAKLAPTISYDSFPAVGGESSKDLLFAMEQVFIFDNGVSTEGGGEVLGISVWSIREVEAWHAGWGRIGSHLSFLSQPFYFNVSNLCSYTTHSSLHEEPHRLRQNWPKFGLCFAQPLIYATDCRFEFTGVQNSQIRFLISCVGS